MSVPVELQWLSDEDGGRQAVPSGPTYTTVAKLEALADRWPVEAWSVIIEWSKTSNEGLQTRGNMRFLVKGGPEHLLTPGTTFELYEGRRLVARGRVSSAKTPSAGFRVSPAKTPSAGFRGTKPANEGPESSK